MLVLLGWVRFEGLAVMAYRFGNHVLVASPVLRTLLAALKF